eukprot:6456895-Amphidinium_carterae.1
MSSAYNKELNAWHLVSGVGPTSPLDSACFSTTLKSTASGMLQSRPASTSNASMSRVAAAKYTAKSQGDNVQPCLTPVGKLAKSSPATPVRRIEHVVYLDPPTKATCVSRRRTPCYKVEPGSCLQRCPCHPRLLAPGVGQRGAGA